MRSLLILAFSLALLGCSTGRTTPSADPSTFDGLQRVSHPRVDAVYRKPNVNFSRYDMVLIRPLEIAFAGSNDGDQQSVLHTMPQQDVAKIRGDITAAFSDVFHRELQTEGGYLLADAPGSRVLELQPAIMDLHVGAVDASTQSNAAKSYSAKVDAMTLVAEFRDSVTGELLARAYDRPKAAKHSEWEWTTSIANTAEARQMIATWAIALRESLDAARGKDR